MAGNGRFDVLNGALRDFWALADRAPEEIKDFETKDALMNAADRVFMERDAVMHLELSDRELARLREKVGMVSDLIRGKGIEMSPVPQQKSTGGFTYRPLLHKRFDG